MSKDKEKVSFKKNMFVKVYYVSNIGLRAEDKKIKIAFLPFKEHAILCCVVVLLFNTYFFNFLKFQNEFNPYKALTTGLGTQ